MVAKSTQHIAPNNVAICCVGMLRSLGWGFTGGLEDGILEDPGNKFNHVVGVFSSQVITVYSAPGLDSDWMIGERGSQRGKVPLTYMELLS